MWVKVTQKDVASLEIEILRSVRPSYTKESHCRHYGNAKAVLMVHVVIAMVADANPRGTNLD